MPRRSLVETRAAGDEGEAGSRGGGLSASSIDSFLRRTAVIAYARFASDGVLVEANSRFQQVSGARAGEKPLTRLVTEGQREEMSRLLNGGELPDEIRNVHFASGDRAPTTLLVTWSREGDELVLLGEPPIADLETTQTTLVKLNGEISNLARENVKRRAQAEQSLKDLRQAEAILVRKNQELRESRARIEQLSLLDPLTGVANRRRLDEVLRLEVERAKRYAVPLSVVMVDLDHFKTINDSLGHIVGDQVLIAVAESLKGGARLTDVVGRYGGDEFIVLLLNSELEQANVLADRFLVNLHLVQIPSYSEAITASLGVVEWQPGDSAARLVNRADEALYDAKHGGRDQVIAHSRSR